MTTTIRATVRKPWESSLITGPAWLVVAKATDGDLKTGLRAKSTFCHSHPEAMQAAYKLMADLDRELMDEVHASRASRRAKRCECPVGMHSIKCHEHERNKHTTEATA